MATATTAAGRPARPKIAQISAEVVDTNPYSRLMALKRMGVVDNYEVAAGPPGARRRNLPAG